MFHLCCKNDRTDRKRRGHKAVHFQKSKEKSKEGIVPLLEVFSLSLSLFTQKLLYFVQALFFFLKWLTSLNGLNSTVELKRLLSKGVGVWSDDKERTRRRMCKIITTYNTRRRLLSNPLTRLINRASWKLPQPLSFSPCLTLVRLHRC